MRRYMLSILGVMATAALILVAFQHQAKAQTQQDGEVTVVGLFEQGGSGFTGIATLQLTDTQQAADPQQQQPPEAGQTEVIVGLVSEGGILGIGEPEDEEGIVRTAGIHSGTCDNIGAPLFEVGDLTRLGLTEEDQQQDDQQNQEIEGQVYAVRGVVASGMDELLTGENVLAVFEHNVESEEEPEAIARGLMHPEFRLDPSAPAQ